MAVKELQQEIYSTLSGGLSVAVYDAVPSGASFPYVVVGEDIVTDESTKDALGHNVLVTVHVFSAYRGMAEVKDIADSIVSLLHGKKLSDGYAVFDGMRFFSEENREIRHGVVQIRVRIFEKE